MPRRGLSDVFHFFIPEREQAEARQRRERGRRPTAVPVAWCLPTDPGRPLACALAVDLARALGADGGATRIVASFDPPGLVPAAPGVPWLCRPLEGEPPGQTLVETLRASPPGTSTLVLLRPDEVAEALPPLREAGLAGLLVPLEPSRSGLARALGTMRHAPSSPRLRTGAVVVGASDAEAAREAFRQLEALARRQLGLALEDLGVLRRDRASDRSLLAGIPVLDLDAAAASARDLSELGRRLASPPEPAGAGA